MRELVIVSCVLALAACAGGAPQHPCIDSGKPLVPLDAGRRVDAARGPRDVAAVFDVEPPTDALDIDAAPAADATAFHEVTVDELREMTTTCQRIPNTPLYRPWTTWDYTVPLCSLPGVVFWRADLEIDCSGGSVSTCGQDPEYRPYASGNRSNGDPLDAVLDPYVTIPSSWMGTDVRKLGVDIGTVVAVIYRDQLVYAAVGDISPVRDEIGEGSYALAQRLWIDPDPMRGGASGGVTFVAFTGFRAPAIENSAEVHWFGRRLASDLWNAYRR